MSLPSHSSLPSDKAVRFTDTLRSSGTTSPLPLSSCSTQTRVVFVHVSTSTYTITSNCSGSTGLKRQVGCSVVIGLFSAVRRIRLTVLVVPDYSTSVSKSRSFLKLNYPGSVGKVHSKVKRPDCWQDFHRSRRDRKLRHGLGKEIWGRRNPLSPFWGLTRDYSFNTGLFF